MKYMNIVLVMLLCVLFLAACGGGVSSSSDASNTISAPGGTNQTPTFITGAQGADTSSTAPSGQSGSASQQDSAPTEELQSVTGVIDDSGMGQFYVELESGIVVGFDYTSADLSGLKDSLPGSPITIYYTGTLNGTDTSGITVVKMETP